MSLERLLAKVSPEVARCLAMRARTSCEVFTRFPCLAQPEDGLNRFDTARSKIAADAPNKSP